MLRSLPLPTRVLGPTGAPDTTVPADRFYVAESTLDFVEFKKGAALPLRLRGGFEITVQLPERRDGDDPMELFCMALQNLGFTISNCWARSPDGVLFGLKIDGAALEITTPPLLSEDSARVLAPLFAAASRLGWTHTTGGGHMHLDLEPFRREPRRFVNFLIALHNNPLAMRLFLPVEGEPTLYQRGRQEAFVRAVHEFAALPAPTWVDVVRLFAPLFDIKYASLRWHDDTFELRCLGNQKYPEATARELAFFEAIWRSVPNNKLDEVVIWDDEGFYRNLAPERVQEEAGYLLAQFDLPDAPYHNWVNDYGKTRRRAAERALEAGDAEALHYGLGETERQTLIEGLISDGRTSHVCAADSRWFTRPGTLTAIEHVAQEDRPSIIESIVKAVIESKCDWAAIPVLRRVVLAAASWQVPSALVALPNDDWLTDPALTELAATLLKDGTTTDKLEEYLGARDWTRVPAVRRFMLTEWQSTGRVALTAARQLLACDAWIRDLELRDAILVAAESGDDGRVQSAFLALRYAPWWKDTRLRNFVLSRLEKTGNKHGGVHGLFFSSAEMWLNAEVRPAVLSHVLRLMNTNPYMGHVLLRNIPETVLFGEERLQGFFEPDFLSEENIGLIARMNWWAHPKCRDVLLTLAEGGRGVDSILEALPRFPFWTEPRAQALVRTGMASKDTRVRRLSGKAWKVAPGKPLPHPRSYLAYLAERYAPVEFPED